MTQKKRKQTTTLPKTNARIEKNQNQKMESETEIIQIIVLLKYPNNDVLLLRYPPKVSPYLNESLRVFCALRKIKTEFFAKINRPPRYK